MAATQMLMLVCLLMVVAHTHTCTGYLLQASVNVQRVTPILDPLVDLGGLLAQLSSSLITSAPSLAAARTQHGTRLDLVSGSISRRCTWGAG
jgi:hypothetical protein